MFTKFFSTNLQKNLVITQYTSHVVFTQYNHPMLWNMLNSLPLAKGYQKHLLRLCFKVIITISVRYCLVFKTGFCSCSTRQTRCCWRSTPTTPWRPTTTDSLSVSTSRHTDSCHPATSPVCASAASTSTWPLRKAPPNETNWFYRFV